MRTVPDSIPLAADLLSRTPPEVRDFLGRVLAENQDLRTEGERLRAELDLVRTEVERLRAEGKLSSAEADRLQAQVEKLEAKLNQNSSNSNKPPSSDSPFTEKPDAPKKEKKPRTRKGVRQPLLPPTEVIEVHPPTCACGCHELEGEEVYYTHQVIELPEIKPNVHHFILHRGRCQGCGEMVKALLPHEVRSGFGPYLSALIVDLLAFHGTSRRAIQDFLYSAFGVPISQGAIQNVVDRVNQAIAPHYEAIGAVARAAPVNHVDETSWKRCKMLEWLWLMCNQAVAFFMLHRNRSSEAFQALIKDWDGILVSDGYGVYQKWVNARQTCLAHLIRTAKGLSERTNKALSRPGTWALKELRLLCRMAKHPPTVGEWRMFYARLIRLIGRHHDQQDEAGQLVRRLRREMENLWVFLKEPGVDPTNNHAERTLRFAVLWRRRSFGTRVDKGDRFVERTLSLRHTCRLQGKRPYCVLVDAIKAFMQGRPPDLDWIRKLGTPTP